MGFQWVTCGGIVYDRPRVKMAGFVLEYFVESCFEVILGTFCRVLHLDFFQVTNPGGKMPPFVLATVFFRRPKHKTGLFAPGI